MKNVRHRRGNRRTRKSKIQIRSRTEVISTNKTSSNHRKINSNNRVRASSSQEMKANGHRQLRAQVALKLLRPRQETARKQAKMPRPLSLHQGRRRKNSRAT